MKSENIRRAEFVRLPGVLALIPISRSALYQRIRDEKFPRPIKFGRASLWRIQDVLDAIERGTE